jgi:hypothetical protein
MKKTSDRPLAFMPGDIKQFTRSAALVSFQVLTATSVKMFFWVVAPCGLVDIYRRFRGSCCLMEAASTSETSLYFYRTTRRNISPSSPPCVMIYHDPDVGD